MLGCYHWADVGEASKALAGLLQEWSFDRNGAAGEE